MADVKTGEFLIWRAADTTGIVGALHVIALIWCETEGSGRDIAADDTLTITDQDGVVILEKTAAATGEGLVMTWPRGAGPTFNGIKITNLDGGELHLWVDQSVYSQV